MFRNSLKKSFAFSSRVTLSNTSRRAFSSARATQKQSNLLLAGAIATPFIGYLAYQSRFNVAYAEEKEEIIEEVTVEETSPEFLKNDIIEIQDIETHPNLLDASQVLEEKVEIVEVQEESTDSASSDDAASQGAYNPETGEINWDCPCLGGMANGPCGEEFKEAFSCFVYSEADPKGIDCVEKFSAMQDCFRKYPEVYSEELREDPPVEDSEAALPASDETTSPSPSIPEVASVEETSTITETSTTTTA